MPPPKAGTFSGSTALGLTGLPISQAVAADALSVPRATSAEVDLCKVRWLAYTSDAFTASPLSRPSLSDRSLHSLRVLAFSTAVVDRDLRDVARQEAPHALKNRLNSV